MNKEDEHETKAAQECSVLIRIVSQQMHRVHLQAWNKTFDILKLNKTKRQA